MSSRNPQADGWGEISVAQPKIWQFERVSALLDGLLRDVEGVSLGDLTQLDPSQQNGAALRFVQSALEVGVQYDQAQAVNVANTLSSYNALHASQVQQLDHYNTYMQTLTSERDRLAAQYSAASNEVNALQALKAAGSITDAQQKQLDEAVSRQSSTQASLTSVNSLISGAGAAPSLSAPPTVTGTSVQGPASGSPMSSTLSGFSDVLKNLPQGVQDNLSTALKSPSYPATKRLDNFITLLYERLAREVSVLQDDLSRDPDNVAFLLQFDVGIYPSKKAKDHVARVEFNLDCPGCKVYSLYPGQSSYNLANYSGSSKRNTFWGNVLTLIGLGVSASYRRQTDTLQGSLVQSVYTAGFQNGVMNDADPRAADHVQVNSNQAEQSFGWYYGAAPFEQLVSPGIRSTFALVTVPRKLIERTEDKFGNTDACVPFRIDAAWASRNDPLAQDSYVSAAGRAAKTLAIPFYLPTRKKLLDPEAEVKSADSGSPYEASVLTMKTSVRLPSSLDDYSLVASREKQKLHVLRMEYNTVFEQPDPIPGAAVVQTVVQTGTQSTNPATGQTTAQTATQTTSTAVAVGNAAGGNGSVGVSAALDPLPCPKGKCAAMLIKLDRPIDPNLVVTVRGEPLMRIRDWRGRATSVLPPAQSGTDLAAAANAPGSLSIKQLQQTRSLLESDQFAPNTWFALNSHEMLLNISVNVATDEEFPIIQLADPSGSVVIPHDLRRSFTELIVNGFRLRPHTEGSIQREVGRQNWREDDNLRRVILPQNGDAPISSGPYAFSTYSPLFSPEPAPRRFFSLVGETGEDLLIGFLQRPAAQKETDKTPHYDWLETQTQVILEDRDQDFAWSLSCDVQGELLACRLPREEISRAYLNFLRACPDDTACPGLDMERQSLVQSLSQEIATELNVRLQQSDLLTPPTSPAPDEVYRRSSQNSGDITRRGKVGLRRIRAALDPTPPEVPSQSTAGDSAEVSREKIAAEAKKTAERRKAVEEQLWTELFTRKSDLKDFSNAFVSTMQVWVEQSDAQGKDVFYSPEPVRIPFLPLSNDYWRDSAFKPWSFETANADSITLNECNYFPKYEQSNVYVSVLGVRSWLDRLAQSPSKDDSMKQVPARPGWAYLADDSITQHCGKLRLPTAALANDPVTFVMEFPPHSEPDNELHTLLSSPCPADCASGKAATQSEISRPLRTTVAMPRFRLGPRFKQPEIRPYIEKTPSVAGKPPVETKVWQILIPVEHSTCADEIELPPGMVRTISDTKNSKSNPDYTKIDVQWRNGLFPLTACPQGSSTDQNRPEFKAWKAADEAGRVSLYLEIPRVAMNDLPSQVDVVRKTSDGVKWVVAALPNLRRLLLPSRLTINPLGVTQFALRGDNAAVIDAVAMQSSERDAVTFRTAPGVDFALVTLPQQSTAPAASPDASSGSGSDNSTQISIVTTKDTASRVELKSQSKTTRSKPAAKAAPADKKPTNPATSEKAATPLPSGTYTVIPLVIVGFGPAEKAKPGTSAATSVEGAPIYMPLTVTDEKGNPLIFTIPDPKKQNALSQATSTSAPTTSTCAVPCAVAPCPVACLQAPTQASAPKSQ